MYWFYIMFDGFIITHSFDIACLHGMSRFLFFLTSVWYVFCGWTFQWRPIVLPDRYIEHASPNEQLDQAGLSGHHIAATALSLLGRTREALQFMCSSWFVICFLSCPFSNTMNWSWITSFWKRNRTENMSRMPFFLV